MPDTPENQAQYPSPGHQKKGVGFPIVRAVAILSLATACVSDLALGPYSGKQTGETALLRKLLASFQPADVVVADRYYCSFMMVALLLGRGVQTCARMHQKGSWGNIMAESHEARDQVFRSRTGCGCGSW